MAPDLSPLSSAAWAARMWSRGLPMGAASSSHGPAIFARGSARLGHRQEQLLRVLEVFDDLVHELGGHGAIDDAVIAGQGEVHHLAVDDLVILDGGPLAQP